MSSTYSPQRRTALVLVGTGTAGAYHAGVLRALREAGVRIDLVAGRGVGAASALFAAVDAGPRLYEPGGLWLDERGIGRLYPWTTIWRALAAGLAISAVALLLPLLLLIAGGLAYPFVLVAHLLSPSTGAAIATRYAELVGLVVSPEVLASLVPRIATAGLVLLAVVLAAGLFSRTPAHAAARSRRDAWWWRAVRPPLDAGPAVAWVAKGFWQFVRGAAAIAQPPLPDLGQRYAELLDEGLGQPGYRELIVVVHDIDARRDLVFALLAGARRGAFGAAGPPERLAELIDLAGAGRGHTLDALAGALSVPLVTEPRPITFAVESHWRGETHRIADRPAAVLRLLEEVQAAGVEQVILVSGVPDVRVPHALRRVPVEPRARLGESIASAEAAAVRDAVSSGGSRFAALFEIRPPHNPVGPFDFSGTYDESSDRRHTVKELVARGYEDAYRQFVEPVVGASGDALGR